jgi:hypothetical protein
MTSDNEGLLTIHILETPAGRKVIDAFLASLFETMDIQKSTDKAKEVAEKNGLLPFVQLSAIIDLLTTIGPLIIKQIGNLNFKK